MSKEKVRRWIQQCAWTLVEGGGGGGIQEGGWLAII